jgi:hypothetical protein
MTALTWILIAVGLVTVAACAARVHHLGAPSRGAAIALPTAAALSLSALLARGRRLPPGACETSSPLLPS